MTPKKRDQVIRDEMAARFRKAKKDQCLSVRGLAKKANTSATAVQRMLSDGNKHSPTLRSICRMSAALGLTVEISYRG